jgi:hypothetical protein
MSAGPDDPVVADDRTAGYAMAMDEVIADNCRMKDIYEPARDDLLDDMVKLTLKLKPVEGEDRATASCFLQVHVFKDYMPALTLKETLKERHGTIDRPKNSRTLQLTLHHHSYDSLAFESKPYQVGVRDYGWHSFAVVRNQHPDVEYCDPGDHYEASPHNLMVRYSTTGVEIASADDSLRVEPWSPGVSLPFGADALLAASTLHTPPAQAP